MVLKVETESAGRELFEMSNPECNKCSHRPEMKFISTSPSVPELQGMKGSGMVTNNLRSTGHPLLAAAMSVVIVGMKIYDFVTEEKIYECPSCRSRIIKTVKHSRFN
jgi:hypothetical protein